MNRTRSLAVLGLSTLAAASLAACTTTSSSCSNGVCSVTLSGAGAETELMDDAITVELVGAADGQAEFAVDGESATCAQGDELTVAGYSVTCTEVGDDKLTVELS